MFLSFLTRVLFPSYCLFCRSPLEGIAGRGAVRVQSAHSSAMIDFLARDHTFAVNRLFGLPAMVLCPHCWSTLPFATSSGMACRGKDVISIAPFVTGEGLLELIRFLKFRGGKVASIPLGWWMAYSLGEFLASPAGTGLPAPLLVPVPLHRRRRRKRGYNQSALLSAAVGDLLGVEVLEDGLVRRRDTRPQTSLERDERESNVEDAFRAGKADCFRERTVVLVDDLMTTGATLLACVKAVRKVTGGPVILLTAGIPEKGTIPDRETSPL